MAASPSLKQYDSLFAQNIRISNQFKQLIADYRTKSVSINATVNAMVRKVNALVTNMGSSVFRPSELFFDRSKVYSKGLLTPTADIKDSSRSNWIKVDSGYDAVDYPRPGSLTVLHPVYIYSMYGGYYDKPKYSVDKQSTKMQFVVANTSASSDQINCEIDNLKLAMRNEGNWSVSYRAVPIHTMHIAGLHPYKTLFVRFVNIPVRGTAKQPIARYGGNSSFKIDRVCNYPEIKY